MTKTTTYDPITIKIIQSSLKAITDEMFATMRKTAMSSIIYEVLDFGVALTDAQGNLASSGNGIPGFIGMLEPGIKTVIKKFGPRHEIRDGDIFIANIPHYGGVSHLNDVVLILPYLRVRTSSAGLPTRHTGRISAAPSPAASVRKPWKYTRRGYNSPRSKSLKAANRTRRCWISSG